MDAKIAISTAKSYVREVYDGESVSNLGLEEVEYDHASGRWMITIGLSRPFNSVRTRAQDVLENLSGVTPLKRSYKVITIEESGSVVSMRNRDREPV